MNHVISSWTNIAYLIAAAAVLFVGSGPVSWIVATALTLLAIGSFGMHYFREYGHLTWQSFDHAGMQATYASIAAYCLGVPWWGVLVTMLAAPLLLEVWLNHDHEISMAVYMIIIAVMGIIGQAWMPLLVGFSFMGLGFYLWHKDGDLYHGLWHVFTAIGTVFLFMIGL